MSIQIDPHLIVTCSAPTNIAVIKYWGKDNISLNTPINSSISLTLDQQDMAAITSVCAHISFDRDRLWLNGREEDIEKNERYRACLSELRLLADDVVDETTGRLILAKSDWVNYHFHISSVNTFPTAAGLASSAAGYACLVFSLSKLLRVTEAFDGQLSVIARQGSGSACRSLSGGFVEWLKADEADSSSSLISSRARQFVNEEHWTELSIIIAVVSDKKKTTSSTSGMIESVKTSKFLRYRADELVDGGLADIKKAIGNKDLGRFLTLMMMDSNQFHATCLDTYPPIRYLNDTSFAIINSIHAINTHFKSTIAGYTFDAGPNAVIFTLKEHQQDVLDVLSAIFASRPKQLPNHLTDIPHQHRGGVSRFILTCAGPGPQVMTSESLAELHDLNHGLIDLNTGLPNVPDRFMTSSNERHGAHDWNWGKIVSVGLLALTIGMSLIHA